jgi:hypothetical protein
MYACLQKYVFRRLTGQLIFGIFLKLPFFVYLRLIWRKELRPSTAVPGA